MVGQNLPGLLRQQTGRLGTQYRKLTLSTLAFFFISLLALTAILVWSDATRKVDRLLHDSWVRYDQRAVPADVVIAAIDADSLNELGRWPWPRQIQARLFEQLSRHGVRVVAIDLLYTESSDHPQTDTRLANAIGSLPQSALPVLTERISGQMSIESLPVPEITRRVSSLGHVALPIDDDGIVRRIFLKAGINQPHWSSLSLAVLELIEQVPQPLPGAVQEQALSVGKWVQNNEVYIPFYGGNGTFPRVSAADIIRGNVPDGLLAGQIVFVGLTTTGLGDVVPTPVSALDQPVPGVEIHANVFAALRDGIVVTRVNPYFSVLLALFFLPPMLVVYSRARPEWGLVSSVVGAILPIAVSFTLYKFAHVWLAPLAASVPILASYLIWSRHRLRYVNRFLEREQQRSMQHVPAKLLTDNAALAQFFASASRHLPLEGWRFRAGNENFSGGKELPLRLPAEVEDRWSIADCVYSRRYSSTPPLLVEICVPDEVIGVQIAEYVDSLARVRRMEQATALSGSFERLQNNVLILSEQLEWLRSIKVFSDTVLAAAPAGFVVWNPAGECIRSNALAHQLVRGYSDKGALADFIAQLQRDPERGVDQQHLSDLVLNRTPWQISFREDDRELVVNFRAVGKHLFERLVCATVIDVTDIRTAEKARAEMVDYLSHDLRSPLISALYLLDAEADKGIETNIKTSLAMMDDLLHIARADDLSESSFEPLLLNSVLDNTLGQLQPQALSKKIRFEVQSDDDLWVVGEAASLERAFTNVVGNAIKYSPPDTRIALSLCTSSPGVARLQVDDEGVGIDPAMIDQLFTRFKRDRLTADSHSGIGLGLALVARVVHMHGGRVRASNLSVGTRITLELPLEGFDDLSGVSALEDKPSVPHLPSS